MSAEKISGINFLFAKAYLALGEQVANIQTELGEAALDKISAGETVSVQETKEAARLEPLNCAVGILRRQQKQASYRTDLDNLSRKGWGGTDTMERRRRAMADLRELVK